MIGRAAWAAAATTGRATCTRATIFFTDGSIGARKIDGSTPIRIAIAQSGSTLAHSRGCRSCSFSFFGLVTSPRYTFWNIVSM